mmetsp:Transcript_17826/g.49993  ORF Transcript_17826/g.49993 Transcript_17826/m.49993 type:complete len:287 (-) Transcript_17826:848-1708(-)
MRLRFGSCVRAARRRHIQPCPSHTLLWHKELHAARGTCRDAVRRLPRRCMVFGCLLVRHVCGLFPVGSGKCPSACQPLPLALLVRTCRSKAMPRLWSSTLQWPHHPRIQARSCDWRFQRLYVAQQEGRSTVHTIFGFYERACPFSADLVELLDGMLQINPRRRMTMREVASATWFLPMSMPKLNIDLATLGVSTSSMISSADSPISLGEIGACDPYGQISPNDVEYEADLAITAGDDANYVDPPPTSTYPLKASSTPVKERYEDSVKGGCRCPIDVDSSISAMCSR